MNSPLPPSAFLPPLAKWIHQPASSVDTLLHQIRIIYEPSNTLHVHKLDHHHTGVGPADLTAGLSKSHRRHVIKREIVPDSGYASAEEEDDEEDGEVGKGIGDNCGDVEPFEIIRADSFEGAFTIRWLTTFICNSSLWISATQDEVELELREKLAEEAASLLATCIGGGSKEQEEEALTRRFDFDLHLKRGKDQGDERGNISKISVELNDAPVLMLDHTSVGLQSWASSIVLTRMICDDPAIFGVNPLTSLAQPHLPHSKLRLLELGAGTGLLSIAMAKIHDSFSDITSTTNHQVRSEMEIVATDFHPDVLENLRVNVSHNCPQSLNYTHPQPSLSKSPIDVKPFDWQSPSLSEAPFNAPFDIILGADVIYHTQHAGWIKTCVEKLLRRPFRFESKNNSGVDDNRLRGGGGTFWLIIPLGRTGRHEGVGDTVLKAFPLSRKRVQAQSQVFSAIAPEDNSVYEVVDLELRTIDVKEVEKCTGVGRADEGGYRLFEIRWCPRC